MVRRSLEHHVLQQVGHARLAVTLMPEPTKTVRLTVTLGRDGSGKSNTCSPLARRYSVIPSTEATLLGGDLRRW